ncbi:hypothetical protein SprV_0802469900 [Sparganum proliferum]
MREKYPPKPSSSPRGSSSGSESRGTPTSSPVDTTASIADEWQSPNEERPDSLPDEVENPNTSPASDQSAEGVEADDARGAVQLALGRKDTFGRSRQSSTDKGIGRRCSPLYGEASVLQTVGSLLQAFAT